jgi:hypothetical protein
MGWVVYQLNWIRQRHEFVAAHEARLRGVYAESWGFPKFNSATAPLGLRILGERGLAIVSVGIVHDGTKGKPLREHADWKRAERLFPEAQVIGAFVRVDL